MSSLVNNGAEFADGTFPWSQFTSVANQTVELDRLKFFLACQGIVELEFDERQFLPISEPVELFTFKDGDMELVRFKAYVLETETMNVWEAYYDMRLERARNYEDAIYWLLRVGRPCVLEFVEKFQTK
jgi:acetone carboxylase gamma subunit